MLMLLLFVLIWVSTILATDTSADTSACKRLHRVFGAIHATGNLINPSIVRHISPDDGKDSPACLCNPNTLCRTIQYALSENCTVDYSDATPLDGGTENVTIILESGVYVLDDGLTLHDYHDIQIIGVAGTIIECGKEPDFDACSLGNIHLQNSSHVYFSGITFQNCLPRVPMILIERSDYIVFDNCTFR